MNKTTLSVLAFCFSFATSAVAGDYTPQKRMNSINLGKNVETRAATLPTPKTKDATDVTEQGYTANWEAVSGAEGYAVYSVLTHMADRDETFKIYDENYDDVDFGTFEEPNYLDVSVEFYLDAYFNSTCLWKMRLGAFAKGMIGLNNLVSIKENVPSYLWSPKIDLTKDNGKFTVDITVVPKGTTAIGIGLYNPEESNEPLEFFEVDLDGGRQDLHFEFTKGIAKSILQIQTDGEGFLFIDNLSVSQNLKAGESYTFRRYYQETVGATSCYFETKDKRLNDGYSFEVCAWSNQPEAQSAFSKRHVVSTPDIVAAIDELTTNDTKVYVNDCLNVDVKESVCIQVYSSTGVCMLSQQSKEGNNQISLPGRGVYMVKVGDKVYKVVK